MIIPMGAPPRSDLPIAFSPRWLHAARDTGASQLSTPPPAPAQEVAGNHAVGTWGRSDTGFGNIPSEKDLIFVMTRLQIRMRRYPKWCAARTPPTRLRTPPVPPKRSRQPPSDASPPSPSPRHTAQTPPSQDAHTHTAPGPAGKRGGTHLCCCLPPPLQG